MSYILVPRRDPAPRPTTFKVGLRFDRSEAKKLRDLADRVRADDLHSDVSCFEQAAEAAEVGEPLVLVSASPEDAFKIVAGYILHGIKRPTIEDLNG